MLHARLLRQHRFAVNRRHAEERDEPHPENCAGAADETRAAGADNIPRADLRRNGGRQRLKGGKPAFVAFSVQGEVAEGQPHALPEAAHLYKAGAHGIEYAGADEQNDENIVRKTGVQDLHNLEKRALNCLHKNLRKNKLPDARTALEEYTERIFKTE